MRKKHPELCCRNGFWDNQEPNVELVCSIVTPGELRHEDPTLVALYADGTYRTYIPCEQARITKRVAVQLAEAAKHKWFIPLKEGEQGLPFYAAFCAWRDNDQSKERHYDTNDRSYYLGTDDENWIDLPHSSESDDNAEDETASTPDAVEAEHPRGETLQDLTNGDWTA